MPSTTSHVRFDAALISESHLKREKLVIVAKEARKFSWAGTGSAATSTASKGTSAGVLALVRTLWFSKPLSTGIDEAGFLRPNPRLTGRVIRVICREILLFTAHFEHPVGFRSDINANLMQDVCLFTRDGKLPFISGADFNSPAKLVARPVHARRQSVASETGSISGHSRENHTHTCRVQKCQIVKSVPWRPHYGVKLTLSINFGSVVSRQLIGKFSERNRHNTNVLQGQSTQHTDSADPAIWNEARRNCVFEGKKPRCQDGQEGMQAACSHYAHACGFLEEADELGHALETWSDAMNQYWVQVGRMCKTPSSGKFATFRL